MTIELLHHLFDRYVMHSMVSPVPANPTQVQVAWLEFLADLLAWNDISHSQFDEFIQKVPEA